MFSKTEKASKFHDPVCGMTVKPDTPAAHIRPRWPNLPLLLAQHCAADAFAAEPGRYTIPATAK